MNKTPNKRSPFVEAAIVKLKKAKNRITTPRITVLECIEKSNSPVSPRDILENITADSTLNEIDKVSIYRILETLLELKLIHQVFPSGNYTICSHLECTSEFHVITACSSCGEIKEIDIPQTTIDPLLQHLELNHSFETNKHNVQINGKCKNCS